MEIAKKMTIILVREKRFANYLFLSYNIEAKIIPLHGFQPGYT